MRPTKLIWIALCAGFIGFILCAGLVLIDSSSTSASSQSVASPAAPQTKPAPPTPIDIKKAELGDQTWDPAWDKIVEEDLPADLLSEQVAKDVHPFCPNFNAMSEIDKKAFWAYFFQALAGAEAGLKPTADVRHTEPEVAVVDGVSHRMVRSEGLLQLTYEDSDRYGCAFDWENDKTLPEHDPSKTILQPKNNLTCGVTILTNQLIAQKRPLVSKSSYWATLRPGGYGYPVFVKQMTNVPDVCRRPGTHAPVKSQNTRVAAVGPGAAGPGATGPTGSSK